jgi:hypothetical protein
MENISKHISYSESTKSETAKKLGLSNTPNETQLANMKLVAERIFEVVRGYFNVPLFIWSFFRSREVNNKTKGASKTSEHMQGKAIDIDGQIYGGITNKEIFNYIKDNLDFQQLIWEFGNDEEPDWVHVSYSYPYNKKEVIKSIRVMENGKSKVKYIKYE